VLAGLAGVVCLRFVLVPASVFGLIENIRPNVATFTGDLETGVQVIIVVLCVLTGFALDHRGLRRLWHWLFGILVVVLLSDFLSLRFLSLIIPSLPLLIGIAITIVLVQVSRLLQVDRRVSSVLFGSASALRFMNSSEVSERLNGGLKLLNTVLPLQEAIVFSYSTAQPFQVVARLKTSSNTNNDPSRNTVWRDGVRLCDQAVAKGGFVIQTTETSANRVTSVAVPLCHEQETTGVLLLRLASDFCEDDEPLLKAVGSQFARNLKRYNFSGNPARSTAVAYFSKKSSERKVDALGVLNASLTEQRCEANALLNVNDGIAIAYLDGTLALTNANLQSFIGLSSEQIKSLDLFSLLDHLRTGVFDEPAIAVRRILQNGIDYESVLSFPERSQTLGLRLSLLREKQTDGPAEPIGIAVYLRELTKTKEYEKLKSDMISLMSHELRTPLTSINGFAELLTVDDTIPEQAREFVTIIANESQRMSRMINTFLAVTQLERKDKQEVLKIPLRLDEVVHDTIMTLQPAAKKKRIRLVEQPAQRVPPVAADKSLITQAVKNLVHNAIKYSPERTTVTVSTALEAEAVRVCVEDRGFGIPSESRDRVWEKFYRVVREGQEKDEESTGLGLSFVREVIEQHGGNVALDSEEGRGSKFSFTLPRL
jgi:signal transduction histidine kinase